jgi:hypothetical protein
MRSSDEMIRDFWAVRALRDRLRTERASLVCDQEMAHEAALTGTDWDSPIAVSPVPPEPCWKAARKWRDDGYRSKFYFDPPQSEWCENCRKRQAVSDAYRAAVRAHGGALRGLLRRGKALASPQADPAVVPVGELAELTHAHAR